MEEKNFIKIAQLKPAKRGLNIRALVLEKGDTVEGISRKTGTQYRLAEVVLGDETGIVKATLWGGTIEKVEVNETYDFENVDTTIFRNALRVNISDKSTITKSEQGISRDSVDTSNDMSRSRGRRG